MSQINANQPQVPGVSPADVAAAPAMPDAASPAKPKKVASHPFGQKAIIHLLVKHPAGKVESFGFPGTPEFGQKINYAVACLPSATLPKHATGETGAVTCPLCLRSNLFAAQQAEEELGVHGSHPADVAAAQELERLSCCG